MSSLFKKRLSNRIDLQIKVTDFGHINLYYKYRLLK